MKQAYRLILILTVAGLIALIAAATYFGAPLFGWIIMAVIFAVFVTEQFIALKTINQIGVESQNLQLAKENSNVELPKNSAVAKRIELSKKFISKKIRLDSPIAYDVLQNSVGITLPHSASGTVILLGLMGTFFGLMFSVATAGGAIDNSTTQGTLDTIQTLFQNMKGIFGTSLCGLFAALVLNISRSLMIKSRDELVADLDAYTLDLQGEQNINNSEESRQKNALEHLFDSVQNNLAQVASSVQSNLENVTNKVCFEITDITKHLNENVLQSMNAIGNTVSQNMSNTFSDVSSNLKTLSVLVESIPEKLDSKLENVSIKLNDGLNNISNNVKVELQNVANTAQNAMSLSAKNIATAVEKQIAQSNEQWNDFMNKLHNESSATLENQKNGLESLKNIALQVAEKACANSYELSQSVAEKLSALSNDILSAFQKLSDTSSVLLDAQKALTESIDNRIIKENEATGALGENIVKTAELMRVNQSELSANLEMLRAGLETILEKLSGDTSERDEEESFVEHLNQSLEAFHERASEVLMENAIKTQEILLEVLGHIGHSQKKSENSDAENSANG